MKPLSFSNYCIQFIYQGSVGNTGIRLGWETQYFIYEQLTVNYWYIIYY